MSSSMVFVLSSGWAYSARRKPRFCLQWREEWCLNSVNSLIVLPCFCTERQWLHPWSPAVESLSPNSWWTARGAYRALQVMAIVPLFFMWWGSQDYDIYRTTFTKFVLLAYNIHKWRKEFENEAGRGGSKIPYPFPSVFSVSDLNIIYRRYGGVLKWFKLEKGNKICPMVI